MVTEKIAPDVLFAKYSAAARELVTKLVWHYQSSGALEFQEEAHQEGQTALWELCQRFDPAKQAFLIKKEKERQQELLYSMIFGYDFPEEHESVDPYANFWMFAVLRVRGGVLDFFRAQKLITKRTIADDVKALTRWQIQDIKNRLSRREDESDIAMDYGVNTKSISDLRPTMFYRERFVSLDRPLSDFGHDSGASNGESFADVLPAPSACSSAEDQAHISYMIRLAMEDAGLSEVEIEVLDQYFSDENLTKAEVAKRLKMKQATMMSLLNQSIDKIRHNWPEIIEVKKRVRYPPIEEDANSAPIIWKSLSLEATQQSVEEVVPETHHPADNYPSTLSSALESEQRIGVA